MAFFCRFGICQVCSSRFRWWDKLTGRDENNCWVRMCLSKWFISKILQGGSYLFGNEKQKLYEGCETGRNEGADVVRGKEKGVQRPRCRAARSGLGLGTWTLRWDEKGNCRNGGWWTLQIDLFTMGWKLRKRHSTVHSGRKALRDLRVCFVSYISFMLSQLVWQYAFSSLRMFCVHEKVSEQ